MKKKILIIFGILVILVVLFAGPLFFHSIDSLVRVPVSPSVSVVFDTGEKISTVSGIQADNAFTALKNAVKQQNLELKTKQYDFGVFVEQIGVLANTKEKSWIYFVNGTSGEVAADTYKVKTGDTVEWKYTTPIY